MGVKTAGAMTASKRTLGSQHGLRELHDFLICIRNTNVKSN